MLSQELQKVLRQRGWSPERKVATHDWVAQLARAGYTVVPRAELILQNFGGLEITPVKTPHDVYAADVVRVDPVTDVLSEVERIAFWETRLAQKLTPIGVLYPSEAILLLGENGQVFCEWGNIIGECGDSFEDALESVLVFPRRKPLKRMVDTVGRLVPV